MDSAYDFWEAFNEFEKSSSTHQKIECLFFAYKHIDMLLL